MNSGYITFKAIRNTCQHLPVITRVLEQRTGGGLLVLFRSIQRQTCHHNHKSKINYLLQLVKNNIFQNNRISLQTITTSGAKSYYENRSNSVRSSRTEHKNTHSVNLTSNSSKHLRKTNSNMNMATGAAKQREGGINNQIFDYLLILDFEATCDNNRKIQPQEVIEFPVLKLNTKTLKVESTFHQYVQPQYHPVLTPFCTELTGIIQEMVENELHLPEVLKNFHEWMKSEGLLEPGIKKAFVTCGDWDLKVMLPKQCSVLDLQPIPYFKSWINIKRSYADVTGTFPKGMMMMLQFLKVKHEGRHHSGIDDTRNIANIAVELLKRGYVFKENGNLQQS